MRESVADDADSVQSILKAHDPPLPLPDLCERIHTRLQRFLQDEAKNERVRAVQAQTRSSLTVIEEALSKYRLEELSLSYNGGKDCLVLLILYLAALHSHFTKLKTNNSVNHTNTTTNNNNSTHHSTSPPPQSLHSVYIISPHPFAAVDDFVNHSVHAYHLTLARYAKPMREAFTDYLTDYPNVHAIFVGTRRTDPHGANLTHFDLTDRGWPAFMRIHPVIDWHYAEIWTFIRELGVEYCYLYDMGYTSLGGTTDTHPNPALAMREGGDAGVEVRWVGEGKFRPAYELLEDDAERLGRDR